MKTSVSSDLSGKLSDRDWQVLSTLRGFKYLTTRQIARQHFGLVGPEGVIPRNANHGLVRLRGLGLVVHLERRIGGARAGSGGYVWQITDLASRLLALHYGEQPGARVRIFEPGTSFLDHTLAIAEVVISLQEATKSKKVVLAKIQLEPDAWRSYLGSSGETKWLKPDVAAVTATSGFEDHWFIEVDRATEPPNRVVKKCLQYQEYQRTDEEQRRLGLFPGVVWVVPTPKRRDQLRERLASESAVDGRLFAVVTPDELATLAQRGISHFAVEKESAS